MSEEEAWRLWWDCDPTARDQLMVHYDRFVRHVAKRVARGIPRTPLCTVDDLVSVGRIALPGCIEKYDEDKGKFTTYAGRRIEGAMRDALRALDLLPQQTRTEHQTLLRQMAQHEAEGPQTVDSLSERCSTTPEAVERASRGVQGILTDSVRDRLKQPEARYWLALDQYGLQIVLTAGTGRRIPASAVLELPHPAIVESAPLASGGEWGELGLEPGYCYEWCDVLVDVDQIPEDPQIEEKPRMVNPIQKIDERIRKLTDELRQARRTRILLEDPALRDDLEESCEVVIPAPKRKVPIPDQLARMLELHERSMSANEAAMMTGLTRAECVRSFERSKKFEQDVENSNGVLRFRLVVEPT